MDQRRPVNDERSVEREEFMRDPGSVMQRARLEGPIAITDVDGTPRLLICIPTDVRPEPVP